MTASVADWLVGWAAAPSEAKVFVVEEEEGVAEANIVRIHFVENCNFVIIYDCEKSSSQRTTLVVPPTSSSVFPQSLAGTRMTLVPWVICQFNTTFGIANETRGGGWKIN